MKALHYTQHYADRLAQWSAVALGFSIPISVALDNVLLALVLLGWLAGGQYREKLALAFTHPVSVAALALYSMFLIGMTYGERGPGDAALFLGKYKELLFIPVLIFVFRDEGLRRRALYALAMSVTLVLVLSCLLKFGVIPPGRFVLGDPQNPAVFKQYLSQGIVTAFGAFLFSQLAQAAASARARWIWTGLALLAIFNVALMLRGRTGYVILTVLVLYWAYHHLNRRGLSLAAAALIVAGSILAVVPGTFQQRLALTVEEYRAWQPGQVTPAESSIGHRLDFYSNSAAIIAGDPLLGKGTGSFPHAYARQIKGTHTGPSRNPHNEYLHVTVQLGLAGLLLMLHLFWQQWRTSHRLASASEGHLARALVLVMMTGCLFNSMLTDHGEGLLFAWLTGVLYGGLQMRPANSQAPG